MKYLILFCTLCSGLAVAAPTYEQSSAGIRAEHARVIAKECTPQKRSDVQACRREANETLSMALRDLREQHRRKQKQVK